MRDVAYSSALFKIFSIHPPASSEQLHSICMNKYFYFFVMFTLIALLSTGKVNAQAVTFIDPAFPTVPTNFSVDRGYITVLTGNLAILPSRSIDYSVTIYRRANFVDDGYVEIYSGTTGPTQVLGSSQSGRTDNLAIGSWRTIGNVESFRLTGNFLTNAIGAGHTNLYVAVV